MRIVSVDIKGLFGVFDHHIPLNQDEHITIIYGLNGFGKTTILRLVSSLSKGSFEELRRTNFDSFTVAFDDDRSLHIRKRIRSDREWRCEFVLKTPTTQLASKSINLNAGGSWISQQISLLLPNYRLIDEGLWEDTTDGEIIEQERLARRLGLEWKPDDATTIDWLSDLLSEIEVRFIQTQRLSSMSPMRAIIRPKVPSKRTTSSSMTVSNYANKLKQIVGRVLATYAERSQQRDQTFPMRLLSLGPSQNQPLPDVERLTSELKIKRARLRDVGLLEKEDEQFNLPFNIEANVQNVLAIYLQDVEEKLGVFDTLLTKLELFKEIIDEHFVYKKVTISRNNGFSFLTSRFEELEPAMLSSGEQHILILIYELLFESPPDSLILIDEPEISLHIAWQLSFLADLRRIAEVASHDFLIATHSPQIINDRWNLTVELAAPNTES